MSSIKYLFAVSLLTSLFSPVKRWLHVHVVPVIRKISQIRNIMYKIEQLSWWDYDYLQYLKCDAQNGSVLITTDRVYPK